MDSNEFCFKVFMFGLAAVATIFVLICVVAVVDYYSPEFFSNFA